MLAAILCGSLSYDVVWEKSDIDLHVVVSDDPKHTRKHFALSYDDINIHADIQPRQQFKQDLESSLRNSFGHSMFARASLIYSIDPSIDALMADLNKIGIQDLKIENMHSAGGAIACWYKAKKWFHLKDDIAYTTLWILDVARFLAQIEVSLAGELVDREALVRATELNPDLFNAIYVELFGDQVSRESLAKALTEIEKWMVSRAEELFEPILDYLKQMQGEPQSVTQLEHHFTRNFNARHVVLGCEWLADLGLIEKASTPTRLTIHSHSYVDELSFFKN